MKKIILVVMAVLFLVGCATSKPCTMPCTITFGEIQQRALKLIKECRSKPEPESPFHTGAVTSWSGFEDRGIGKITMDNGEKLFVHYGEICYPSRPRENLRVKFNIKHVGNYNWAVNVKEISTKP